MKYLKRAAVVFPIFYLIMVYVTWDWAWFIEKDGCVRCMYLMLAVVSVLVVVYPHKYKSMFDGD